MIHISTLSSEGKVFLCLSAYAHAPAVISNRLTRARVHYTNFNTFSQMFSKQVYFSICNRVFILFHPGTEFGFRIVSYRTFMGARFNLDCQIFRRFSSHFLENNMKKHA